MKPRLPDPSSPIAPYIVAFIGHKRALNRRYDVEDKVLRMFDGYLNTAGIMTLAEITPAALDAFFLSRPRTRPRSFNHLVGVVSRLFEWMAEHGIVDRSPVTMRLRRRGQPRAPCMSGDKRN
jgi:site-specific recombinase XerD